MGFSSHRRHGVATLLILLLPTLASSGLVNLGMVSLKGSLGIGLRPSPGKGEPSGPLISTYYGHGLGPGGNSHASGSVSGSASSSPQKSGRSASAPNFVTSCCKGKLKLFGQNIFGHGHFKGQYVKPPTVTNYHHLHTNEGSGSPGVGVVSINDIHDGGDHPVKFKNYESYKHRQYPKQETYQKPETYPYHKDEGSYTQKYNYKKYKTPPPVQGFDDAPFWTGHGNKEPGTPLVIEGGGDSPQNHGHSEDFHHPENDGPGRPPSHHSDAYPPPPGPGKDGLPNSHYPDNHNHDDAYPSRYPPPPPRPGSDPGNNAFHDYSETDGVYHSHPNSPSSPPFSNSIYDNHDKPGSYPSSSGYRTSKGFVNTPYYPPSPGGSPGGSPPIQVIDHHHPPGSGHFPDTYDHEGPQFNSNQVHQDPKYPPYSRRNIRNGFTPPNFRPIPRTSLIPTQPMTPMPDSSSWMPFKSLGQRSLMSELKSSGSSDKDLKYRVYEYGKNEVIIIDGGLKPHEKDLVRAHVYSKDEGKLLRTIEIKDAVGSVSKVEASRRSDVVEEDVIITKPRISFVTDKPVVTSTNSTPSPATTTQTPDSENNLVTSMTVTSVIRVGE